MLYLDLDFVDSGSLQLSRVIFSGLCETGRVSVCGENTAPYRMANPFHWVPAVQAMSILLLRTAAWLNDSSKRNNEALPALRGEGSTPASSLDYALSKMPSWLAEMFGRDEDSNLIALALFKRENPERKQLGPVTVSVDSNAAQHLAINIRVNDRPVTNPHEMAAMATAIGIMWQAPAEIMKEFKPEREPEKPSKWMPTGSDIGVLQSDSNAATAWLMNQFAEIWHEVDDESFDRAVARSGDLFATHNLKALVCLDRESLIDIINERGDANISYSINILNLTGAPVLGRKFHVWYAGPTELPAERIEAISGNGEKLKIDLLNNNSQGFSFYCWFPSPLLPLQTCEVSYSYFSSRRFSPDHTSSVFHWALATPLLTNKLSFQLSHRRGKSLKGVRISKERRNGGTLLPASPHLEINDDAEVASVSWRWEEPTWGDVFQTCWEVIH